MGRVGEGKTCTNVEAVAVWPNLLPGCNNNLSRSLADCRLFHSARGFEAQSCKSGHLRYEILRYYANGSVSALRP